jgi:MYXO-CTERM domain-containing protein
MGGADEHFSRGWPAEHSVATCAVISGVCLAGQVALTDFGGGSSGPKVFWLLVGLLMLWLVVRRRSRLARAFVVVSSLLGGIIYALLLLAYPGGPVHAAVLSALFFGQALPLMTRSVRDHVRRSDRADLAFTREAEVPGRVP